MKTYHSREYGISFLDIHIQKTDVNWPSSHLLSIKSPRWPEIKFHPHYKYNHLSSYRTSCNRVAEKVSFLRLNRRWKKPPQLKDQTLGRETSSYISGLNGPKDLSLLVDTGCGWRSLVKTIYYFIGFARVVLIEVILKRLVLISGRRLLGLPLKQ